MRIVIGCDHAGFPLKIEILKYVRRLGYRVIDIGAHRLKPGDDYPDYAKALAQVIQTGRAQRGILVCGSGVGASIAVNKFKGIRAALCEDTFSAHQGVEDDDANVLCLGARITGLELAFDIIRIFLKARFSSAPRHRRRVQKIKSFELGVLLIILGLVMPCRALPVRQLNLRPGENYITSIVVDEKAGRGYLAISPDNFKYTLEQASGTIVQFRLSDLQRTGTLMLHGGENALTTGLVDAHHALAYFGTYGDPNKDIQSRVVKINLSSFKRIDSVELGKNEYGINSATLTPGGDAGLFGTLFGSVIQVDLNAMQVSGDLGLAREDNAFQCALMDPRGRFAYFATATGNLMKIQMSDFTPIGNVTVLRGEPGFKTAIISSDGETGYFCTQGSPAKIIRISLADLAPTNTLILEPGENQLVGGFLNPKEGIAYFVTTNPPIKLIKVSLEPFKRLESIPLPGYVAKVSCAAYDSKHNRIYLGTGAHPAKFVKIDLAK